VAAVPRPTLDIVRAQIETSRLVWLTADFPQVMAGVRTRTAGDWEARQRNALAQLRAGEYRRLRHPPTPRRGLPPTPQPTAAEIDAQVEATLSQRRCEIQQAGLQVLEGWKHSWMVARQNQILFDLAELRGWDGLHRVYYGRGEGHFHASRNVPVEERQPIPAPLGQSPHARPVAPEMVDFLIALHAAYPQFVADNYEPHGSTGFQFDHIEVDAQGRKHTNSLSSGFSVDLFLTNAQVQGTGFWEPQKAIQFLLALQSVALARSADWKVLYNDYRVARYINQATAEHHVGFMGGTTTGRRGVVDLNFHGPEPLVLHFHLDLRVQPRSPSAPAPAASPAPR